MRARSAPVVVLLAALWAVPVLAGTVPDSAARAALQARIGRLGKVRLLGPAGEETFLLEPVVREDGLHMRRPWHRPRPALVVIGEVPSPPPPPAFVPWSEIARVQVAGGAPAKGFLSGAIFGAGLSAILIAAYHETIRMDAEVATPVVAMGSTVLVVGCAALGAVIGSFADDWRTVYPEPSPAPARRRP